MAERPSALPPAQPGSAAMLIRRGICRPTQEEADELKRLREIVAETRAILMRFPAPDTFLGRKTQEPFPWEAQMTRDFDAVDSHRQVPTTGRCALVAISFVTGRSRNASSQIPSTGSRMPYPGRHHERRKNEGRARDDGARIQDRCGLVGAPANGSASASRKIDATRSPGSVSRFMSAVGLVWLELHRQRCRRGVADLARCAAQARRVTKSSNAASIGQLSAYA